MFLKGKANFSRPIVRLGIVSVMLGVAVMVLSVSIVTGFQEQVRDKVTGFAADIRITSYEMSSSQEFSPIDREQGFLASLDTVEGIRHVQAFASKAGIIKTDDQIEGVILKGVGSDFDWSFFRARMTAGHVLRVADTAVTDEVIISRSLSDRLFLRTGDPVRMYFINNNELQPRGRKFTVAGIYETGLEEFDRLYVIGDIGHIRKLNGWAEGQVGGFEVYLDDYRDMERLGGEVNALIGYDLRAETARELNPQIFEWLDLHNMNVIIILALMVLVAGITMVSTLLILILEKTNMIGTLKALGTKNKSVRLIFLVNAVYIIGQGLLWGNLLALSLSLLQLKTGIFKLNQESYYVSEVPVNLEWSHFLLINLGTVLICTLMLIIPTYIITRITPVRAIRFD